MKKVQWKREWELGNGNGNGNGGLVNTNSHSTMKENDESWKRKQ